MIYSQIRIGAFAALLTLVHLGHTWALVVLLALMIARDEMLLYKIRPLDRTDVVKRTW